MYSTGRPRIRSGWGRVVWSPQSDIWSGVIACRAATVASSVAPSKTLCFWKPPCTGAEPFELFAGALADCEAFWKAEPKVAGDRTKSAAARVPEWPRWRGPLPSISVGRSALHASAVLALARFPEVTVLPAAEVAAAVGRDHTSAHGVLHARVDRAGVCTIGIRDAVGHGDELRGLGGDERDKLGLSCHLGRDLRVGGDLQRVVRRNRAWLARGRLQIADAPVRVEQIEDATH